MCIGPYRPKGRARDLFASERRYLRKAIERERPELVHAHWTYEFGMAAIETGYPNVISAHDAPLLVMRYSPDPYRFMRLLMAWKVIRRASHMTAVSAHIAKHIGQVFRYRGDVPIIPNGIPDYLFKIGEQGRDTGMMPNISFASVLNGWDSLKNGKGLIMAFSKVRGALPQSRLVMFGQDYGQSEKAHLWAKSKGLDAGVHFVGHLPYSRLLSALKQTADILVHPSKEESFSMAIAEAMALGLPVIAGQNSGAVPETLGNGLAGLLADVSSPSALADAMCDLANDQERRRAYSATARKAAREKFGISKVASLYESIFTTVLAADG
jgi:glycosyltransferase involved in cell wall biosynthesis